MKKPLLYDMFCGSGGASLGYAAAGFEVVGVDLFPQKSYPFPFIQMDALEFLHRMRLGHYPEPALIAASPPCQAHTQMQTMHNAKEHADLIPETRAALIESRKPYIIENVEGAPLLDPIVLCGTMFGLGTGTAELWRHRLFETTFPVAQPTCRHYVRESVIGVYGGHARNRKRRPGSHARGVADFSLEQAREAMGVDRFNFLELSQMIPPVYCRYIGAHAWVHLITHP